ncbi:MAG: stage 0 sporulation family protein [Chloroflexi bacterium]|nr:stage 0 sporulation family protein [Chloroflexota bacterium]
MADVVGVRFKRAGRVYYFNPAGFDLQIDDCVVVETARGLEVGQVVIAPKQVLDAELTTPLKPVVRKAELADIQKSQELAEKEKQALVECGNLVTKLNLPMKLLSAEYNLDGSRLTIYFSAEDRVDFRELVRQLAASLKTRVELRQVGPRDEAKLIGGFGRCGRHLCCCSFLSQFAPVSIKMAKEQDLPLNPMKISGVCGRLLCCLTFENEHYRATKGKLPKNGTPVSTPMGTGVVVGSNSLKETVYVELESKATIEVPLGQITILKAQKVAPGPEAKEDVDKSEPD